MYDGRHQRFPLFFIKRDILFAFIKDNHFLKGDFEVEETFDVDMHTLRFYPCEGSFHLIHIDLIDLFCLEDCAF